MPQFRFKAIDASGRVSTGSLAAEDGPGVASALQERGLFLLEHGPAPAVQAPAAAAAPVSAPAPRLPEFAPLVPAPDRKRAAALGKGRVSMKELALVTAQLSAMVRSALPILEAMELLVAQASNETIKGILTDIQRRIGEGEPLSKAFARHPKRFDEIYIGLLAAGEAGGRLDMMLDRLTQHMNFRVRIREKLQSALVYPAVVMATAFAVLTFLVVFVLPVFDDVFKQLNIELPLMTRLVIGLGALARRRWYLLPLTAAAVWAALKAWVRDPGRTLRLARLQLRVPVFGTLLRDISLTRVLRTLASLLDSGVSMIRALELARTAGGNPVFQDLLVRVSEDVMEGKGLAPSLAKSPFVPPVVVGMIATGERTGTLPESLNRVAEYYEAETDSSIKNMFAAMEPAFVVGLGLMVGGIAVAVLLPMFNLAQGIN